MKERINGLDLFSGIGGNTLALRDYVKTIAYCDADRHAQAVLLSRMADGSIEPAPIWDDVTTLRGEHFDLPVDIIVGGFPCQDISVAGTGAGLDGKRSGLVFEIFRLIRELRPTFVFLENVPAIRTRGGERVVKELAALGYDCRWDHLSAADVGAPHKRERWFLLAAANPLGLDIREQQGRRGWSNRQGTPQPGDDGTSQQMADTASERRSGELLPDQRRSDAERDGACVSAGSSAAHSAAETNNTAGLGSGAESWWATEPDVGRVADECALRVDRLKRLGNGVVPAQAREAFERLMGLKPSTPRA